MDIKEVEFEYRKSIVIPKAGPSKQLFFCPVGLVGAGKTTITKPIAEKLGLVRLSSDEVRKILKENGFSYEPLKEIAFKIAEDFADKGYSIAFDSDCGNPETKEFIEKLAVKTNAKIFWVHVDTPQEFIFDKFRKHPPSWLADNPQTMIDNYLVQKERREKEHTQFDFIYTFDTSRPDVPEQIEECLKKMKTDI